MQVNERYNVYKTVIDHVLTDTEYLPSLPAITLKVRNAIGNPNITTEKLASLIGGDPALCALILRTASSPIYKTKVSSASLNSAVNVLGLKVIDNLVMVHSIKSLFTIQNPTLKAQFDQTWRRQIIKSAMAVFLAKKLRCAAPEDVLLSCLMTEVGTLAVLSAFREIKDIPRQDEFYLLFREYSKRLGMVLLNKWNVADEFIAGIKACGAWRAPSPGRLSTPDVINLALYSILQASGKGRSLPGIQSLSAYKKLLPPFNHLNKHNQLVLIADNREEIQEIIRAIA